MKKMAAGRGVGSLTDPKAVGELLNKLAETRPPRRDRRGYGAAVQVAAAVKRWAEREGERH